MNRRGLAQYQTQQHSVLEVKGRADFDIISKKAELFDVAFLQNRALVETILALPETVIESEMIQTLTRVLQWCESTEASACMSR